MLFEMHCRLIDFENFHFLAFVPLLEHRSKVWYLVTGSRVFDQIFVLNDMIEIRMLVY